MKSVTQSGLGVNFVVLEETDETDLNNLETFYVALFRCFGCDLKNLTDGGDGVSGYSWSDDAKEVQSEKMLAVWKDPDKAARISAAQRSAVNTPEWRSNNSAAQKLVQKQAQSDPQLNARRGASVSAAIRNKKIQIHRWQDDGGK